MQNPLLSIGIIFKNEIRCLERCVKSLQPLRDSVPCELVMADTGSDDGSREVAEQYADILFDFPWIDDFAAARNAVIDRCSGEWFLTVDADEWLDADVSQLVHFLTAQEPRTESLCAVVVRNYFQLETDGEYNDFLAIRLMRLSSGVRYVGAIHEHWDRPGAIFGLGKTILHHDGYAGEIRDQRNKTERNMGPLREKLAQNPEDMRSLLQCIESTSGSSSHEGYIRQAAAVVEKRRDLPEWEDYGPPILRYAVHWAAVQHLPELGQWSTEMLEWFPNSIYTTVDVACVLFVDHVEKQEYAQAIPLGEGYLRALSEYNAGRFDYKALIYSTLMASSPFREEGARVILADQYFHVDQFAKAQEMLLTIDRSRIQPSTIKDYTGVLLNLHAQSGENLSWLAADLWEKIEGAGKKRGELKKALLSASAIAFSEEHRQAEEAEGFRHAYTVFLPLSGQCGLGTAAEILESDNAARMEELLTTVDDWEEIPIVALERALLFGAALPAGLRLEEMDVLAERLSRTCSQFSSLLDDAVHAMDKDFPSLLWARGMALAAVSVENWEDGESGLRTARVFSDVERTFLPRYYTADFLTDEKIQFLPPMHRFGWYCAQAFDTLDAGDKAGYVRLLREGLSACESAKPVVESLLENTPELQMPKPSPELLELAEKVRTMLAAYAPDDPAVQAVRASTAYQRVAHLIEGPDMGLYGGLPQ